MARSAELQNLTGIASRLGAFVAEQHPFALDEALEALEAASRIQTDLDLMRKAFKDELERRLAALPVPAGLPDATPGVTADARIRQARAEVVDACDGFMRRESLQASLTADERREILRGMVLTRATDNRLKTFFISGEVRYG